ncbi:MAG TPA: iron ABC transporter permease [Archaeoglobus veneficus]|nr:iron ABC transporter permease [Archaeoglobus veneficus]
MKLIALLTILIAIIFVVCLSLGPSSVGFEDVIMLLNGKADSNVKYIIIDYRMPRIITSMLVGVALATAGCSMQALFRNPLADPYILGISSGASVGAAIVIFLGIATTFNIMLSAFIFSLITAFVVYKLGETKIGVPIYTLLLAGVAMASFLSGLTSLLIYLSGKEMHQIVFWIMGGFWAARWEKVWFITFPITFSIAYVFLNAWNLNAILMGEEHALSVGIDVESFKRRIIGVATLLTSSSVAVSGIIGFVGIIIPHAMRLIVGENHKKLIPATILFGAAFMPIVDLISRTITDGEIPVGIITALLGAPFFIYLLRRAKVQ